MQTRAAAFATIPVIALLAVACDSRPAPVADRPECPHDWAGAFGPDTHVVQVPGAMSGWTTSGDPQQFLISGEITNVPEFHDCQRLVPNAEGARAYGRLAAVFARARLDSVVASLAGRGGRPGGAASAPGVAPSGDTTVPGAPSIRAVAEIASEGAYESLGIGVGFNCLLLRFAGSATTARMIALGTDHTGFSCVMLENAAPPPGATIRELQVLPTEFDRVPPVARWEWDTVANRQLIGVKCGAHRWCVVGPDAPPHPVPTRGLAGAPRGMTAPGWYDEQSLAVPLTDGSAPEGASPTLLPSGPFSTIFPDEALEQFRRDTYPRHEWIRAAHIAMPLDAPEYGAKLGLARTTVPLPAASLKGLNQLQLCFGTVTSCKVREADIGDPVASGCTKSYLAYVDSVPPDAKKLPVWARIVPPGASPNSPETRYHCVTLREHLGVEIPAVVRWRWRADDETIWAYCPSGCCEVHSSPM